MKYVELARVDRRRLFQNYQFSFEKRRFKKLLFVIHLKNISFQLVPGTPNTLSFK